MAAEGVLAFLEAIDAYLARHAAEGETLELCLLGRSALILGYGLMLMTKDVDVVLVHDSPLLEAAVVSFGKEGRERPGGGLYLETASSGLPPLPGGFQGRCVPVPGPWQVIRPKRIEPHDLIVSKLSRFHAGDRLDVQILCDTGEISIDTLRERFERAHDWSDRDDPKVIAAGVNLETVIEYLEGRRRNL